MRFTFPPVHSVFHVRVLAFSVIFLLLTGTCSWGAEGSNPSGNSESSNPPSAVPSVPESSSESPAAESPVTESPASEDAASAPVPALPASVIPASDIRHEQRFREKAALVAQGKVDLLFLGDSITHRWDTDGKDVQERFFGDIRRVNLGLGANLTQHVLWELENIEADKISPKVVMLLIGTNNLGNRNDSPADTAAGTAAVVEKVRELWPDARILLLGIFPRGNSPEDPFRKRIAETNAKIELIADRETVFYLDLGERFLDDSGTLRSTIAPDYLHLSETGYEIWGKAVAPILRCWIWR